MEIEIVEEKENPYFKRKELKVCLAHPKSPTPSKLEIKKEFAKRYSVDESQVIIDYIFTKKGSNNSLAKIKILSEKPKEIKEDKSEAQASKTE